MKKFVIVGSIIVGSFNAAAQSFLTFPSNAFFYDLAGDDFLALYQKNEKTHVMRCAMDGSIIWQDSISFVNNITNVQLHSITAFDETDLFVVANRNIFFDNIVAGLADSAVYQFSLLSLQSEGFIDSRNDTLLVSQFTSLKPMRMNDTLIYFFNANYAPGYTPVSTATYQLSANFSFSPVAIADSINNYNLWYNYTKLEDTIISYNSTNTINADFYTTEISHFDSTYYNLPFSFDFQNILYFNQEKSDSIFFFVETTPSGSLLSHWTFTWLNHRLELIDSLHGLCPIVYYNDIPSQQQYHRVNSYSRIVVSDSKIYVLAEMYGYEGDEEKVFVYDFGFNLICEIPIEFSPNSNHILREINNMPYFSKVVGTKRHYYEIDDCVFTSGMPSNLNEHSISFYPNPTSDYIKISNPNSETIQIKIFDNAGKIILTTSSSEALYEINLSGFANGIYFVHVNSDEFSFVEKIIKK